MPLELFSLSFYLTVAILLHKIAPRGSAGIAAGTLTKTAAQNRHFREKVASDAATAENAERPCAKG